MKLLRQVIKFQYLQLWFVSLLIFSCSKVLVNSRTSSCSGAATETNAECDTTVETESSTNTTTNTAKDNGSTNDMKVAASLAGAPDSSTTSAAINVAVSGTNVTEYKYSILFNEPDCSNAVYSGFQLASTKITDSVVNGSGTYRLCVIAKNTTGSMQQIPTQITWTYVSSLAAATGLITAADSALGPDIRYDDDTTIYFVWSAASDSDTGLRDYTLLRYDQANCAGSPTTTTAISSGATSQSFLGFASTTYSFKITAYNNNNENAESLCSNSIMIDTSPPTAASVLITAADSALGSDTRYDDDTTIYFAWTAASDAQSGIASYTVKRYALAACAGVATDVTGITGTSYSFAGVGATTYSYEVVAINNAGLSTTSACSGDITIDTTAPVAASSLVTAADSAAGPDIRFDDDTTVYFAWSAGSDAESGIVSYTLKRYALAACAGSATDMSGITGTSQSFTGVSGTTYSFSIVAINGAGGSTTSACSGDIAIDTSAPTGASSLVTAADSAVGADVRYDDDTTIYFAWAAGSDAQSGIADYTVKRYALTNCGGTATDMTGITATFQSFTGSAGTTYSFTVVTFNKAGLSTTSGCSGDITIDTSGPTAASGLITAADSAGGADTRYDDDTTIYFAWTAGSDAQSGISSYTLKRYALAACGGSATDVTGITGTSQSFTGTAGTVYSFAVDSINGAGLSSTSGCSGSITIDTTNPNPASSVNDGTTSNLVDSPSITWSAGSDGGSGINHYEVAIGTSAGATNVVTWTDVGTALSHSFSSLSLTDATVYYATIRVVDNAGNISNAANGDGWTASAVTIPTAPVSPAAAPGDSANIISWSVVSGATSYNLYWATSPGVTTGSTKITGVTSPYTHTGRTNGTIIYYKVAAENAAGESPLSGEVSATPTAGWQATTTTGAPTARMYPTLYWTGTKMFLWGGITTAATTCATDGKLYDTVANTWTALPTTNAPSACRSGATAFTGTEIYFWGGTTGPIFTNTGSYYNVASNTWTPMSTTNAPSARADAVGVWTGATGDPDTENRFIVWGGNLTLGGGLTATGAVYNRANDTWTTMSTTGAPSARFFHAAVWTGSKMLVWGGATNTAGTTFTNTGAIYDPKTNTWSAMDITNAPSARWDYTYVWASEVGKLIVFGGDNNSVWYNTGAMYDIATGNWTAMDTTGAPTKGEAYSIWTGTKMIVWGGYNGSATTNTGYIFNPTTNLWEGTISTTSAPAARATHSAVFTGSEIIVWGGSSNYTFAGRINTGGRLVLP